MARPANRPEEPAGDGIQTIAKAAAILRALEHEPEGLSLAQIAAAVDMPRSTVQRLVDALKAEALVTSAGPRGGVRLGPLLVRLAGVADNASARRIRPIIQDLSRRLRETVDVSTLVGAATVFVDQCVGRQRLVALSAIGERFPVAPTAPGKALLASFDRSLAEVVLQKSLREFPGWPVADLAGYWSDIDACRARGFAYDEEEHSPGISAVGVALIDPAGLPLMISIPCPAERFARNRERFAAELLRCRKEAHYVLFRGAERGES